MMKLHTFGAAFGLPDPSPFVTKADLLLKMAGVKYEGVVSSPMQAPKGKLPYVEDCETTIADSTFIRFYLEQSYKADFTKGLSEERAAALWAAERYCEGELYFILLASRWLNEENFKRGPAMFFDAIPFPLRGFIKKKVVKEIKDGVHLQGLGRHSEAEQVALVKRGLASLSALLGAQDYFGGKEPVGADATLFGFILGAQCDYFDGPWPELVNAHSNLVAYTKRMLQRFYPEMTTHQEQQQAA